uniref:Uncharacterized protein n=1 Tax=Timema poppense TaxID=170557 RepID=A0A7R9H1B8_TIMPO|nr:unnamed protein product [Timema poppensis]
MAPDRRSVSFESPCRLYGSGTWCEEVEGETVRAHVHPLLPSCRDVIFGGVGLTGIGDHMVLALVKPIYSCLLVTGMDEIRFSAECDKGVLLKSKITRERAIVRNARSKASPPKLTSCAEPDEF